MTGGHFLLRRSVLGTIWSAMGSLAEERDKVMSAQLDTNGVLSFQPPFKAGWLFTVSSSSEAVALLQCSCELELIHLYLKGGKWSSSGQYSGLSALGWAVSLFSSGVLGTVPGERSAPGFWGDGRTLCSCWVTSYCVLPLRAISSSCRKKHRKNRASNNNASLQFFPSLQ